MKSSENGGAVSREVTLRIAFGSTRGQVVGLVVRRGMQMALTGLGLGLAGAYLVGRSVAAILFGVGKLDLPVFVCIA